MLLKLDRKGTLELTTAVQVIAERYGIAPMAIERINFGNKGATITYKETRK